MAASCAAMAGSFSKGDRVEMIKEAPLYFNDTTLVRMAPKGEQFTVIGIRPEDHRVYLSARDAAGKTIALNVGDDDVALVKVPASIPSTVSDTLKAHGNASKDLPGGVAADLPVSMRARTPEAARMRAITQGGGKKESEAAVLKGLKWLAAQQDSDGSWASADKPAMTSFALLAFLGHGETTVSADFGPTMQKAIDWLLKIGEENAKRPAAPAGMVFAMRANDYMDGAFAHGIATFALGEYYTISKDERVTELLSKAIRCIVVGQAADGGWHDDYSQGGESDTWTSIPQIQALKVAHLSGLKIDGVDAALGKAMRNLKRVQADNGSFGYRKAGDMDITFTGAGVFCTYLWKHERDRSVRDGIEHLLKQTEKEYPIDYHHASVDLHAWYYGTQACFMLGGAAWNKWNRRFADELIRNQNPNGSWPPVAGKCPGGEPQRDPEGIGPCYRTSLCLLMLEVYYRYLPESAFGNH